MAQNIPVSEVFWSLVDKADKKFSRVRDLPLYGRNVYDSYFHKVFKVYTQLWKFQQENRQKLVEAGLKRWEIGEIASRIAQLYYNQYLRTSESNYLNESYIFYEAILNREYFKENSQDLNLATKQLRCYARFLIVCLVLNRREIVEQLVNRLKMMVDECKRTFQETDFKEWKQVVHEIVRFLKADTAFMNIRPLRYSLILDPHPDSLPRVASFDSKRGLRLREAVLSSYHHNEVKLTELTLDTFRMIQCLEWEPSGSFYQMRGTDVNGNGADAGQTGSTVPNRSTYIEDIVDPTLPSNPRKAILYRPAVTHFIAVLATICEELPPYGILLIYLSAAAGNGFRSGPLSSASATSLNTAGHTAVDFQSHNTVSDANTSPMSSPRDSPTNSSSQNKGNCKNGSGGCLWLGSRGNGGLSNLYPCDLIPFTRRPLFLIIDSDCSHAFKAINGAEKGETAAMLLSPSSPSPTAAGFDSGRHPNGNQFTAFLTAPLQSFCLLLGFSGSNIEMETYNMADKLLSSSLSEWGMILATSSSLSPVWGQVLCDPFLRRLILRFIFCRAVVALYAPTFNKKEFLPECLPQLPESVLPANSTLQTSIFRLANVFGAADRFIFSDGVALPESDSDMNEPAMSKSLDAPDACAVSENGH